MLKFDETDMKWRRRRKKWNQKSGDFDGNESVSYAGVISNVGRAVVPVDGAVSGSESDPLRCRRSFGTGLL